ncbi:hypothetical protein B0G57_12749 [Trinickia symbiotica]|uniref:Uncharacterized protein n=1 Tax=Trinickia symbiotica TaxID=863227 RepID=A0A2N7WN68_9BURK|nr:hypothetical protein [Trinickia symbiotica]PMS30863.1 hypothetical protein C0Z20_29105 [Trinickia symbiotica]PPK41634.1 hypothetical protein B0G57_12749 [Trinickia symbiotica]
MKHADFFIGLEFLGLAGFRWRCTDVGARTIVAVRLDHNDPNWYRGPPYVAKEVVFDEHEIERCHLTEEDAILAAIEEVDTSGHPGYPGDVVNHMMKARFEEASARYPHEGVLRFDRCAHDGEIFHPYAGRKDGAQWIVQLYLPFRQSFLEMPEREFIMLPIATAADVRARADQSAE